MLKQADSIVAVHPGALGDVILFGHLLKNLDGPVTLVTGGEKGPLLEGLGVVQRAVDFDALPMHEVFTDQPMKRCRLPALLGRHDRLVSCFVAGNAKAEAALAEVSGAKSAVFLPVRPPTNFRGHLVDLWTQRLSVPALVKPQPPWPVPMEWRRAAAETVAGGGVALARRYVVIHPGAGAGEKCWLLERFLKLIEMLRRKGNLAVVSVLGPVELERWKAEDLKALASACPLLSGLNLRTFAGVLAGAAGFVGNDSGPAHLAAAVGTPTVVVTTVVSQRHFAPIGPAVTCVARQTLAEIVSQGVRRSAVGLLGGRWRPAQPGGGSPAVKNRIYQELC